MVFVFIFFFFFSSRRRHTRFDCDWSSDVCSSDLTAIVGGAPANFSINILRTPDFTTTVDLQVSGVPPGVSASFTPDWKSTRLNSSHSQISYAVFCLKKKKKKSKIH